MSLIMLLAANSRLPYADLAEKLNLSVNAVHKRIQQLIEAGVIKKFSAKISLLAAKAMGVYVFGTSSLNNIHDLPEKVRSQGSIFWLAMGSGKFLYMGAYLRDVTELDPLVNYIKKEAGIQEPTVGIMSVFPQQIQRLTPRVADLALCDLDYRIIGSLKDDSRKALSDVANELGISAKTVRRRLERMIKNNLIELGLEWYPDKSNDIITLAEIHIKPEAETAVAGFEILKKYGPNTLFFWSFANIPNVLTFTLWTNSMNELQNLREKLENEKTVESVIHNILYIGYIFETWRDQLLLDKRVNSSTC
jgi:DNA-binding Lrp family transcriptional regulator